MNETELKHVIALLLEDAKRLVQLEPDAGTKARIWLAKEALESGGEGSCKGEGRAGYSPGFGPVLSGAQSDTWSVSMIREEKILEVASKTAEFMRDQLRKSGFSGYIFVDVAECLLAAGNASRRELIAKGLEKA